MIYLDSSALLKLLLDEPDASAFRDWYAARTTRAHVSSELLVVEARRTCRRVQPRGLPVVDRLLARMTLIPLTRAVVDVAGDLDAVELRSLDALHVASALSLGGAVTTFVTYDRRLSAAATAAGLDVVSPSADDE